MVVGDVEPVVLIVTVVETVVVGLVEAVVDGVVRSTGTPSIERIKSVTGSGSLGSRSTMIPTICD